MKASDIPDTLILEYLAKYYEQGWTTMLFGIEFSTWVDGELVEKTLVPENTPPKVLLAKMRSLYRRKLITGCPCSCRGDWEITPKGLELLTAV